MVMTKKQQEKIVTEALDRFDRAAEAEEENRRLALEDLKFVDEDDGQWTDDQRAKRKGRPCMTFDRTSAAVDQVVGDMLQNRPGIKVRPMEDGDDEVAEIYTGLIRGIEAQSNAKRAYKTGFKFAARCGYGVWRVRHDYACDDSFDQDLLIEPVPNPFAVLFDPDSTNPMRDDGRFCFVFDDMNKEAFEEAYPKAQSGQREDFQGTGNDREWFGKDYVRVAEYYRKVPVKRRLYLLSDGSTVDADEFDPIADEMEAEGITIKRERSVDSHKIEYYKLTGAEVLEEVEYTGKFFPVVPVWGKQIVVDGKFLYRGLVRKAKDSQRLFNYELNSHAEVVSMQGKAPYLATPNMIKGFEKNWQSINTSSDPVLPYNLDNGVGPRREMPPQASQGMLAMINLAADNIKSTTGIFDASMGARSNETSGRAIEARDRQGDTATFEYADELHESLQHTGRILVDLIPKIYDADRQIRILGEDDAEEVVKINRPTLDIQTGEVVTINDLSKGSYDVTITTGGSYSTKRQETAEQMGQIIAQNPEAGQMILDLYLKSLDLVGGDEAIKRVRKLLISKGIIEPNEEEQQEMAEKRNPEQEQQKAQIEQKMIQLGIKEKQVEIADKEASALQKQASAKETAAQAMLHVIEAQKARGDYVYNSQTGEFSEVR